MQINAEHLEFLVQAQTKFKNDPSLYTCQSDDGDLIALCYRYHDETVPSIVIHELGPQVAFFANILDTEIKVGESE